MRKDLPLTQDRRLKECVWGGEGNVGIEVEIGKRLGEGGID